MSWLQRSLEALLQDTWHWPAWKHAAARRDFGLGDHPNSKDSAALPSETPDLPIAPIESRDQ